MTKKQLKKLVAKDVLKWIGIKIQPQTGAYISTEDYIPDNEKAKEALCHEKCEVCAMGAIAPSLVDRFNKLSIKELYRVSKSHRSAFMNKAFSPTELYTIEVFFECSSPNSIEIQHDIYNKYFMFLDNIFERKSDEERMIAIFKYIAKTGEFEPDDFILYFIKNCKGI